MMSDSPVKRFQEAIAKQSNLPQETLDRIEELERAEANGYVGNLVVYVKWLQRNDEFEVYGNGPTEIHDPSKNDREGRWEVNFWRLWFGEWELRRLVRGRIRKRETVTIRPGETTIIDWR